MLTMEKDTHQHVHTWKHKHHFSVLLHSKYKSSKGNPHTTLHLSPSTPLSMSNGKKEIVNVNLTLLPKKNVRKRFWEGKKSYHSKEKSLFSHDLTHMANS